MEIPALEEPDTRAIKEARTTFPVLPLIRQRWSARAFSERPITEEELLTVLEAASWAPSAMNEQPWRYRYAFRGTPWFHTLWDCLLQNNRLWAQNAGALVVCSGKLLLQRNGQPNNSWQHDLGMANANLLTQAVSMGIYGHLMGGFDHPKANVVLSMDTTTEEIVCFLALGHLAGPEGLPEPFHTREIPPRVRRPLPETVTAL